ncbi:hypothetical protein Glove_535g14 [Diversispora epigaea]|uniref:Uncharacterized protein n=1 Tax=Diversispora epigaea TaxID=1348612 RepID=A0A397GGQ3_9GLOM|nr:hypothetical protein Glove_535g14 [Diversispora epigaea]
MVASLSLDRLNSRRFHLIATLSPGIYIQKLPSGNEKHNFDIPQFLLIHSEDGCYEDSASSIKRKTYLTKLCEHQICLMSDKDLACINWQRFDVDDDDDDDGAGFIFEVKKPLSREMLLMARISDHKDEVFDSEKFREYFQQKLKTNKYSLLIDRKVTMAELEIIVNDDLKLPDLLMPYHSDLKALNEEKNIETR